MESELTSRGTGQTDESGHTLSLGTTPRRPFRARVPNPYVLPQGPGVPGPDGDPFDEVEVSRSQGTRGPDGEGPDTCSCSTITGTPRDTSDTGPFPHPPVE